MCLIIKVKIVSRVFIENLSLYVYELEIVSPQNILLLILKCDRLFLFDYLVFWSCFT